jgi:hypothetical protein
VAVLTAALKNWRDVLGEGDFSWHCRQSRAFFLAVRTKDSRCESDGRRNQQKAAEG